MRFVIMLDKELDVHPDDWPISAEKDSLDAIRKVTHHSGIPALVSRRGLAATKCEPKSLINAQTGQVDRGAIYQIRSEE